MCQALKIELTKYTHLFEPGSKGPPGSCATRATPNARPFSSHEKRESGEVHATLRATASLPSSRTQSPKEKGVRIASTDRGNPTHAVFALSYLCTLYLCLYRGGFRTHTHHFPSTMRKLPSCSLARRNPRPFGASGTSQEVKAGVCQPRRVDSALHDEFNERRLRGFFYLSRSLSPNVLVFHSVSISRNKYYKMKIKKRVTSCIVI